MRAGQRVGAFGAVVFILIDQEGWRNDLLENP
jgi:hypothetical protein